MRVTCGNCGEQFLLSKRAAIDDIKIIITEENRRIEMELCDKCKNEIMKVMKQYSAWEVDDETP
jgi:septum formation topological specificity factor MinE